MEEEEVTTDGRFAAGPGPCSGPEQVKARRKRKREKPRLGVLWGLPGGGLNGQADPFGGYLTAAMVCCCAMQDGRMKLRRRNAGEALEFGQAPTPRREQLRRRANYYQSRVLNHRRAFPPILAFVCYITTCSSVSIYSAMSIDRAFARALPKLEVRNTRIVPVAAPSAVRKQALLRYVPLRSSC
jgi:hypothetical protein